MGTFWLRITASGILNVAILLVYDFYFIFIFDSFKNNYKGSLYLKKRNICLHRGKKTDCAVTDNGDTFKIVNIFWEKILFGP